MTLGQLLNGQTVSKAITAGLMALIGSAVILLHGGAISATDLEHAAELAAATGLATFLVPNRSTVPAPAEVVEPSPSPAVAGGTAVPEGVGA